MKVDNNVFHFHSAKTMKKHDDIMVVIYKFMKALVLFPKSTHKVAHIAKKLYEINFQVAWDVHENFIRCEYKV
jgi:hypothetical protein